MEVSGWATLLSRRDLRLNGIGSWVGHRVGLGILEKRKHSCPPGIGIPVRLACEVVTVHTNDGSPAAGNNEMSRTKSYCEGSCS
jgi:hypothetical protein